MKDKIEATYSVTYGDRAENSDGMELNCVQMLNEINLG